MLDVSHFSAPDPFLACTEAIDAAREAYVVALQVCDDGVRRGDEAALDAALQDAANRFAALQTLSQRWLQQSAQRKLWMAVAFPLREDADA